MCRLYGLQATHPTRPACELLDAQNALVQQSREDARGLSNPHGWGMGHIIDGKTSCFRQVKPATESEEYRNEALSLEGTTVLAHVRRATVGEPDHANTHPFRHGNALLIHNGHVPAFDRVQPRLLDRLDADRQRSIGGTTDSEHVFALLGQLREENPGASIREITREGVHLVQGWVDEVHDTATVQPADTDFSALSHEELVDVLGLNLLWTDGETLGGVRLNRTLWVLERNQVHYCEICESDHAHPPDDAAYRSVTLASERLTDEDWQPVPNGSVFDVSAAGVLKVDDLSVPV